MIKENIRRHVPAAMAEHLEKDVVLTLGSNSWSRLSMADDLGCVNFLAAARLTKTLRRLKITTANKLYNLGPWGLYNTKGVGDAQLLVAMHLLDTFGLSVNKWWKASKDVKQKRRYQKRGKQAA
jgi:tRNA(Ile2) C34 agmatinyltransferase TiaS